MVKANSGLSVEDDYVLDATGRVTNFENLGLEELGIPSSRRGIQVNDHLHTCVPNLVFTLPRIAQVGVTVDEAEKSPQEYRIVSVPYGIQNEWSDKDGFLAGAALYDSETGTWLDFLTLIIMLPSRLKLI